MALGSNAKLSITLLCLLARAGSARPTAGDSCSTSEDHCGAPESQLGCCYSNTKCYAMDDCATYLSGCPFSNDTKKGERLSSCLPDSSSFSTTKCPIGAATATGIPIVGAEVKCYESDKLTCHIYSNATHKFVTAGCKAGVPAANSAGPAAEASTMGILVSVFVLILTLALLV